MPITEARVPTDRPGRYLVQLCKHFSNKGRHLKHRPRAHGPDAEASAERHGLPEIQPDRIHVEWTDTHGTLVLPWGKVSLQAATDVLLLRVEAGNEQDAQRLRDLLTTHLHRFGRRDELQVTWESRGETGMRPAAGPGPAPAPAGQTPARRTHLAWAGLAVLAVLAITVHLGLAGAVLSAPHWTGWAVGAVLTAVAIKLAAVMVLGRRVHRQRRRRAG
jgi:hypothetical protein